MIITNFYRDLPHQFGITDAKKNAKEFLFEHPEIQKVVLIAFQILRAALMIGAMTCLNFSAIAIAADFIFNFSYAIAIENQCPFGFAIPSAFGALSYHLSQPALLKIANGLAFSSFKTFIRTFAGALPIVAWTFSVIIMSHNDVEDRNRGRNLNKPKESCCH